MSNAKPTPPARRWLAYTGQLGTDPGQRRNLPLTPRQARRTRHKDRKGKWGFGYPGTKGYATYPRARAIAERQARRRG